MAQTANTKDLRDRVSMLLKSPMAGQAVADELGERYKQWQDRAAIGDLRMKRLQHRYDTDVMADSGAARAMLATIAGRRH